MGKPGSGRYTTYVPVASDRNTLLRKLFNKQAGNSAVFYGAIDQTNNSDAAQAIVNTATANAVVVNGKYITGIFPKDGKQYGDTDMFPQGVNLSYGGAPDTTKVSWSNSADSIKSSFTGAPVEAGGPANPYVPDITSPGPGKTDGTQKETDPGIKSTDIKPNFDPTNPSVNTKSPAAASVTLGTTSLGEALLPGKSSVV